VRRRLRPAHDHVVRTPKSSITPFGLVVVADALLGVCWHVSGLAGLRVVARVLATSSGACFPRLLARFDLGAHQKRPRDEEADASLKL